jgi:hypothetical protein
MDLPGLLGVSLDSMGSQVFWEQKQLLSGLMGVSLDSRGSQVSWEQKQLKELLREQKQLREAAVRRAGDCQ